MSYLFIKVPSNVANILSKLDVPGKKESIEGMHITLAYLGKESSVEEILKIFPVLYDICKDQKVFDISTNKVSSFPKNEDGIPVFCEVKSAQLSKLRNKIIKAFDKNEIEYDKTYPDFNPHITLSYSQTVKPESFTFPEVDFVISEIELYAGAYQKQGVNIRIPLGSSSKAEDLLAKASLMYKVTKIL